MKLTAQILYLNNGRWNGITVNMIKMQIQIIRKMIFVQVKLIVEKVSAVVKLLHLIIVVMKLEWFMSVMMKEPLNGWII